MNRLLATFLLAAAPLTAFSQNAPNATAPDTNGLTPPPDFHLTPEQLGYVIKGLDQAQDKVGKTRVEILSKAMAVFKAALASDKDARDLYLACYKTNHFDKKDAKDVDFALWKTKYELKFKDPEFLLGIHLQLQYLVLTMQNQDAKDLGPAVDALKTFMATELNAVEASTKHNQSGAVTAVVKPSAAPKAPGRRGNNNPNNGNPPPNLNNELVKILQESVRNCEFAKAYMLEDVLRRDDWEYIPVNFGGIFKLTIFPYVREKKASELPANWDLRINLEFNYEMAILSATEYEIYWAERRPERLWDKAKDLFTSNVNPSTAVREMLKVVQDYPSHPRAVEWINSLRQLTNQSQPAVAPTPPPTTGTAPTADATPATAPAAQ